MNDQEVKKAIEAALQTFPNQPTAEAASHLFEVLGYTSQKRLKLSPNNLDTFIATFAQGKTLNGQYAFPGEWKSIDFLFQLTDDEIRAASNQQFLFESKGVYNGAVINSYLFFALELKGNHYTRSALAGITRELNKLFAMPALVLFRHGETLTLAVINRRLHKRDEGKDVLEKVTLIQNIQCGNTHRAHVEILFDLSLDALYDKHGFTNFVELQAAWQKTLDTAALNKRFYQELANWYFWAIPQARFPEHAPKDADGRDSLSLIRLITRVIFCWFLKEKRLLPDVLFDPRKVPALLNDFSPKEGTYYQAILQNLFFATLNQEMGKREFRKDGQHFMAHNLYRYRRLLKNPDEVLKLFASIPFMNGGLFECLDKMLGTKEKPHYVRIDGFSDRDDNSLKVPNDLFFGPERIVDLSGAYGNNKFKSAKVAGLIHILDRYKFTVAENTPIEEEVALDPELLGKVFENLLAAYNPETGATARKQTGSFYTPREIVHYMVDESLIAILKTKLEAAFPNAANTEERLRHLCAYNDQPHQFTPAEGDALIEAIDHLKILDPACGSGAFPMGILHKLVFVLSKLDPGNQRWKARQLAKASEIPDATVRERVLADIEQTFGANELDYGRKLYLIENCIYGVDIQPIAVQISKLRFFISLVVDQKMNPQADNLGIRPLPNLETKFVAANTLIGMNRPGQQLLRNLDIAAKEAELRRVRERHFLARTPVTKAKCREQDAKLRAEIAELLKNDGWDTATARELASWDPYDQNASANFFDLEWMFGITDGFGVVIGNPPYGFHQIHGDSAKVYFKAHYAAAQGSFEHYFLFYEASLQLVKANGVLAFIAPVTWLTIPSAKSLRQFVLKGYAISEICWLSEAAFESASVNTLISLIHKNKPTDTRVKIFEKLATFPLAPCVQRDIPQENFVDAGYYISIFSGTEETAILDKVRRVSKPLAEFARPCSGYNPYEVGAGIAPDGGLHTEQTVKEKPYHSDKKRGEQWKPEVVGRDLSRYHLRITGERWVKYGPWLAAARDPDNFKGKRILIQEITGGREKRIVAAFHDGELYHSRDVIPIRLPKQNPHPLYLLAVINSWLISWYHQKCNPKAQKGLFPKVLVSDLKKLPIFPASAADQHSIVKLAEEVIAAKQKTPDADTIALEREIDCLVYALYDLTPDEICLVEESAAASVRRVEPAP